jgi:FkbM family methyltransferase
VLAVEADPAALHQLDANIAANPALSPRISVLARAAAPEPGLIRLGPARKPGDSMSSILHGGREGAGEVEAATPSALMAAAAALGDGPLTVKIDIEGGEYALLPALVAALPERTTTLLCAFHPRILAASGGDAGAIGARTARCLEALQGWSVQVLDDGRQDEALSTVLTTLNATVLCSRTWSRR